MVKDNTSGNMLNLCVYTCQWLLPLWIAFFIATSAHAISVNGTLKQGGYIIGKLEQGETAPVSFNGNTLEGTHIGQDGTFVFGISRNAEAATLLTYTKDGKKHQLPIIIEPQEYKTQAITGVAKRKVNPNSEDMVQIKSDKQQILASRSTFTDTIPFISGISWPVSDTISGIYGSRRTFNGEERSWHKGLDIAAPTGTKVHAPTKGVVRLALDNSFFNGNLIVLDHGHQLFTIYAHLDEMYVKEGQTVTPETVIGAVGTTGRSTGPHLHWGLYWRNMALDPLLLMKDVK